MREVPVGPPESLLGAVPALLWACDGDGRRTWFSAEWLRVRGRAFTDEVGDGWLAGVHGDDRGEMAEAYFGALAAGTSYEHVFRLLAGDGTYRRMRDVARPVPGGGLVGVCEPVGRSRQIDAARAQSALGERLRFFDALFEAAPVGMQLYGADGTTLMMNQKQARLLGLASPSAGAGTSNALTDPMRLQAGSTEDFQRALAGEVAEATLHFETADGGRWVDSTLFPVLDEQGRVQTVVEFTRDVTERVRAEKALRESEENYRLTVESLNDMVFRTNRAGQITYVSPATPRQSGYLGDDLEGRPATDVWERPEDAQRFLDLLLTQGRVNDFEAKMFRKDGKPVWISLNATVMRDEEGHVAGVTGSIRDISERKRMEAALAEAEARFRRIVETGAEGIYILDLDGRIEFANEALAQLVGYTVEELVGMEHRALVATGKARPREEQGWRRGEVERFELEYRHRKGQPIHGVVSVAPMQDSSGNIVGGLTMVTDMTERNRAEAERDRIFQLSLDMLTVLDRAGRLARCNPAWQTTTGFQLDELEGSSVFDYVHPDDIGLALDAQHRLGRGEAVFDLRLRFRCAKGYRWFSWNISAPAPGALTYCVVRDVTEQVEAQQAQEEMLEALRSNAAALEEQAQVLNGLRLQAEFLADHDSLTGALNRRAWFDEGVSGTTEWCVAIIDVDHFKRINDTFGHPAGDTVLIEVTQRLMAAFQGVGGIVGRIGGEEFGVLLPVVLSDAYHACEVARLAVASHLVRLEDGRGVPVSVSVGLAPWYETGQSRERSLARTYEEADRALYEAKNTGRARLVVWSRAA